MTPQQPAIEGAPSIRWTVRQAGYRLDGTVVTTSPSGSFRQHFVLTRHGLVARTWLGPDFTHIALRRPRNTGATYQGSVRAARGGGWQAFDDFAGEAQPVGGVYNDYLDAEAVLLRRRTGHRSTTAFAWPAGHLRELDASASGATTGWR